MSSWSFVTMLMFSVLWTDTQIVKIQAKKVADIYWNSSNPIFAQNNSFHDITVRIKDSINFICPVYRPAAGTGFRSERELSIIYLVDRMSSDLCKLPQDAKVAGVCDDPSRPLITVVFRRFTPNLNGLEFSPGRNFYFIRKPVEMPVYNNNLYPPQESNGVLADKEGGSYSKGEDHVLISDHRDSEFGSKDVEDSAPLVSPDFEIYYEVAVDDSNAVLRSGAASCHCLIRVFILLLVLFLSAKLFFE